MGRNAGGPGQRKRSEVSFGLDVFGKTIRCLKIEKSRINMIV